MQQETKKKFHQNRPPHSYSKKKLFMPVATSKTIVNEIKKNWIRLNEK